MIGVIQLKDKYRFVTNKQQLTKLANELSDENRQQQAMHSIIFVDATLQADFRTSAAKLLIYIVQMARRLDMSFVFIGEERTPIDTRIKYSITDKLSVSCKPILASKMRRRQNAHHKRQAT